MYGYFYNKNLRKLVVGFGSLFNNIFVEHDNPDGGNDLRIRVPISYAPQEKFIQRLLKPSSIDDTTKIETQLPLMSYMINRIVPDPSRRRNKFSSSTNVSAGCGDPSGKIIYHEVPVNISFSLFIYTRHIDDTLQIFEQIIPYFNPEHIIKIDMNDVYTDISIPITMTDNSVSERYDGDFMNRRINISSINFIAKSYIFGELKDIDSITTTNTDYTPIFD